MDGISAAASVLAVGTAGVQISIKLIAFANQVATASERVRSIGVDISLTANVLQQLGELMSKPKQNEAISIFSEEGLATTQASAAACEEVFRDLEVVLNKANGQFRIKAAGAALGKKITLSKVEALKWPFLQPGVDSLRTTLNNARETLMLILHVTTLAYMKKLAELSYPSAPSLSEQSQQVGAILALHRSQAAPVPTTAVISHNNPHSAPKDNQRAPDSPTLDSSDIRGQDCAKEPLPPATPSTHTTIRSTVDPFASRNDMPTTPITGFSSSPRREADEALPGPLDTTGFGDEPTQSAQHDQNDPNLANRSSNALSNDQNLNKHRQAVDDSSELSKSMQVWMIEPTISKAEDHNGYDIRWYKYILPLSLSEFKDESRDFRRHFWQKKKSLREQFANLSHQERHVLHYFLNEGKSGIPGDPVTITMKSIKFMKMRPAREPITRMPWRCIHVLIEDDAAVEDRHSTRDTDEWQRIHPRPPHRQMLEPFQPPRPRYDAQHHAQYLPHQQIQGHIPVAARHHSHEPQLGYPRHQHQLDHHPHHDLGDEIFPVEDFVPREEYYQVQLPPKPIEIEPRARMPTRLHQRSRARGRSLRRRSPSSDSLFSGSERSDRHQSGHGRRASVYSDDESFRDPTPERRVVVGRSPVSLRERPNRRQSHFSSGANFRSEGPEAPAPLSEDAGYMQSSELEDKTAEDPTSEELSAEASQRIIDDLLAKYTTIYS